MSEKRCPKCGGAGLIPRLRSPKNGQIIMWKQCPDCQGGGMETHTHEGTQQKPTVTRKQIEEIIIDIDKAVKATLINYLVSNDLKIATNVLSEWLKVHGIEVMK